MTPVRISIARYLQYNIILFICSKYVSDKQQYPKINREKTVLTTYICCTCILCMKNQFNSLKCNSCNENNINLIGCIIVFLQIKTEQNQLNFNNTS